MRSKMRTTTTIAITGNRDYVAAINLVARLHGQNTAQLVRSALETLYAPEIENALSFFVKSGTVKYQSEQTNEIAAT